MSTALGGRGHGSIPDFWATPYSILIHADIGEHAHLREALQDEIVLSGFMQNSPKMRIVSNW